MSYLLIRNDLTPKVSGIRQGISQGKIDSNLFLGKEWLNEFLYGEGAGLRRGDFPKKEFELTDVWLDKKAHLTDFISIGALRTGFIISEKVVDILKSSNLPQHKFYKVTFNRSTDDYYWFYYNLFNGDPEVDFTKSEFDVSIKEKELKENIIIRNFEDYMRYTISLGSGIVPSKLVFNHNFDRNLDFFGMRFLGASNYISSRLRDIFIKEKVTGYKALPLSVDHVLDWQY